MGSFEQDILKRTRTMLNEWSVKLDMPALAGVGVDSNLSNRMLACYDALANHISFNFTRLEKTYGVMQLVLLNCINGDLDQLILHEIAHACQFLTTGETGHNKEFREWCRKLGCREDRSVFKPKMGRKR